MAGASAIFPLLAEDLASADSSLPPPGPLERLRIVPQHLQAPVSLIRHRSVWIIFL
jgi:hypothetical protein